MLETANEMQKIARAFVQSRLAAQALDPYPGGQPENLGQAYAIQDFALPLFGDRVVGWKVGRINGAWLDTLGVTRLVGPIFERSVMTIAEGESPAGAIFANGFGAVEAEFIFRIGQTPPPGQTSFTAEQAADLVDAVFCGFEVASSPFAGINDLGPLVTISDFGNNNGLLIGPEVPNWRDADLDAWVVNTEIDNELAGSGRGKAFAGGLIESVRFLLENLVSRGIAISPGMLISTGAVTGVHEVTAGQRVEALFGDKIRIGCTIKFATA